MCNVAGATGRVCPLHNCLGWPRLRPRRSGQDTAAPSSMSSSKHSQPSQAWTSWRALPQFAHLSQSFLQSCFPTKDISGIMWDRSAFHGLRATKWRDARHSGPHLSGVPPLSSSQKGEVLRRSRNTLQSGPCASQRSVSRSAPMESRSGCRLLLAQRWRRAFRGTARAENPRSPATLACQRCARSPGATEIPEPSARRNL